MITGSHSYRRHLPHFQSDFKTYFVTFVTRKRFVLPEPARDVVLRHVVQCEMYWLHVAVVMLDHVHVLITPGWGSDGLTHPLNLIMRQLKGASSREANLAIGRKGSLWLQENFDHQLRREESLLQKAEYIRQNPVRKGLVERPEDYPWLHWNPKT
jgi:REP element-mobilizing transposase RayT